MAASIPATATTAVVDVRGLLVVPGLIDAHVHVFYGSDPKGGLRNGFAALPPDAFSFRTGVTTMVDAGSSGWRNFDVFKSQTISQDRQNDQPSFDC